ncbi:MAG TPA: ABC transporter permease [Actinomycetota bacterium]|jgi:ABC-2 type transport system permease protein|nr:ABC transporter permease [Actinomycetota bacterium]
MHDFGKFLRDSRLIFRRTAQEAIRNAGLAFVAPTLLALFVLVLFQGVFGRIGEVPEWPTDNFINWVASGGVLLSVFVGAGYTATGLLRDIDSGFIERLRLLPIHPASVFAGKLAFEAVRAAIPASVVLTVATLFGADMPGPVAFVAIVLTACLLAVAWNGIFYVSALKTRNHSAVLGLQPLFMPVIMFSTFWVPAALMPGWFRTVAEWNPFTPILDASRSIAFGNVNWGDVYVGAIVIIVLAVLTYRPATRMYGRATAAD